MTAPLPVVALYQKCKARVSGLTKPASPPLSAGRRTFGLAVGGVIDTRKIRWHAALSPQDRHTLRLRYPDQEAWGATKCATSEATFRSVPTFARSRLDPLSPILNKEFS